MIRGWRSLGVGAALLVSVHACDQTSPTAGIDRGGVRTPVSAQGPITGFGSVIVGGVHYSLDTAELRIDGGLAVEGDLALGQIVTIRGSREAEGDRGNADSVAFRSNVQGPVTALEPTAGTLVVLGQSVSTDGATVFDLGARAPSVVSLGLGETVRVSGFVRADGAIAATRIEQRAGNSELRVVGKIARLDRAAARFEINALAVSYAAAVAIEGFPEGRPNDGDEVVVVGTALGPSGELLARTLERHGEEIEEREGNEIEIEGLITRFVSPQDFDVADVTATTTAATVFEGGTADSLTLNLKVHVKGRVDAAQRLEARKIEIED